MEAVGRPNLGALLRQFRLDAGMTQQDLAERAKLSVEAIGLLERGARTRPQRETLVLLGRALALSPEREALLASAVGIAHPPRRRSEPLSGSLLRIVRPEPQTTAEHNLPLQLTSFVGREHEVAEIAALLREHRVVTVVGAGGVGKTRVAVQTGIDLVDGSPNGVWLVDLAPLADRTLLPSAVLAALQQSATAGSALDAIVAYLKTRRLLLILDNCEHVIAEARELAATIAASCPGVRVLATSREPLNVPAEQVYRLPSLAAPPDSSRTPRDASSYGAVALFVDRALAVDASFALTEDNTPAVAEICRRLDGIPLAIELAAARANVLAPRQIAQRLDQRFRLLTGGDPRALPRHQTMTALIDWSYDLLTPREQRFFEWLSVFAGGCTLDAATAVCATDGEDEIDVVGLIGSLVTKSLVLAELVGSEQRYSLLESSRQYACDKLAARGEQERVARRHALAYLDLADRLHQAWNTTPEREWLARANVELENWRAALEWALAKRGDVIVGQRLAGRTCDRSVFALAEGRRWVRAALESVDQRTPPELVARLEYTEAYIAAQFGERKVSLAAAERALVRFRELGDALRTARAQQMVASSLALLERPTEAESLLREALETARSQGDRHLEADVLLVVGWVRSAVGDFNGARASLTEALGLARVIGAESFEACVITSLAENEFDAGNAEAALQLTVDLLQNRTLDFETAAIAAGNVVAYLIALVKYDEARVRAVERLELIRGLQMAPCVANSLRHLALVALLSPQHRERTTSAAYAGAARLLGFYEGRRTELGMSTERGLRQEHDRALAVLREAIGADELEKLMALGARMTEDEAIAQAQALE